MKVAFSLFAVLVVLFGIGSTQVTFMVMKPIKAIPEGATMLIVKEERMKFIDTPEAVCKREKAFSYTICSLNVMAHVKSESTVIAQLPYLAFLREIANNGKE